MALLPGVQVDPPEPDVAADAVAGRPLAALTQPVELAEGQPQEARRLTSGDHPQPILSWRRARQFCLGEVASLLTLPSPIGLVHHAPSEPVDSVSGPIRSTRRPQG